MLVDKNSEAAKCENWEEYRMRIRRLRKFGRVVGLLILVPFWVLADRPIEVRGDFVGVKESLVPLMTRMDGQRGQQLSTRKLGFSMHLPGTGLIKIEIQQAESPSWPAWITDEHGRRPDPAELLLLRGRAIKPSTGMSEPVFGSLERYSGSTKMRLFFKGQRSAKHKRLLTLEMGLGGQRGAVAMARVRTLPALLLEGRFCAAEDSSEAINAPEDQVFSKELSTSNSSIKQAQVATDADYEYYLQYGSGTNSNIASVIRAAGELYEPTFGLNFEIVAQNAFVSPKASPYSKTSAPDLLEEFQIYTLQNGHLGSSADIYHLFTGKDFDGPTIGIAYVGTICQFDDQFSFGVSQRFDPTADAVVFAHEVGHNLNANHDLSDPDSIMYPAASLPAPTKWSTRSKSEISTYLRLANCFSEDIQATATPTATPTRTPTLAPGETPVPTAIASPTPTVGRVPTSSPGPGAGGPGLSPTLPPSSGAGLSLKGRFRRGVGTFDLTIADYDPSCVVELLAGSQNQGVPERVVYSRPMVSSKLRLNARVSRTVARGRLELRARVACRGSSRTQISDTLEFPMRGMGKRRVRAERWLSQFARTLKPGSGKRGKRKG